MESRYDPREEAAKSVGKKQVGGNHYKKHKIQPWDIIDEYGLDYHRGAALKYMLRNKMDVYEDIQKAVHELERWLEHNAHLRQPTKKEREEHFKVTGTYACDDAIMEWLRRG